MNAENEIALRLRSMGFKCVCTQEPSDEELDPGEDAIYPIEWAHHVWKRDSDCEFVVVSISRCWTAAHEPVINIDAFSTIATKLAEQSDIW